MNASTLESIAGDMPSYTLKMPEVLNAKLLDLMCQIGLQPSKSEARRLIRNGGVYLNNHKIEDENYLIQTSDLIEERLFIGCRQKNKVLIRVAN